MLQETWLNKGDASVIKEIKDQGYNLHTQRRLRGNNGGGVAILYKPNLIVRRCHAKIKFKSFEYITCTVHTADKTFRIINIYRMGYTKHCPFTYKLFLEEFAILMENNSSSPGELIITGDFNFHMEKPDEDKSANEFLELVGSFNLHQHIKEITHINGGTLDLILTEDPELVKNVKIINGRLNSDHHPIQFNIICNLKQTNDFISIEKRNYKNMNMECFKDDLAAVVDDELYKNLNSEDTVDLYTEAVLKVLNKHCPIKSIRCRKRPTSPWFSDKLAEMKRTKRKFERKFKKCKTEGAKADYDDIKHRYNCVMAITRNNYYRDKLDETSRDIKSMYKTLNKVLGSEEEMIYPTHMGEKSVANDMAAFFSTKIKKIRTEIERKNYSYDPHDMKGIYDEQIDTNIPNITPLSRFNQMTCEDVKLLIKSMNSKFSSLDPIPTWLLKDCIDILAPIITHIINTSLQTSTFPKLLKHAIITPILKDRNGDTEVYNNYRPISNTAFIAKIVEKAALQQINNHIEIHALHATTQSGYRKFHSCETATLKVVNDIKTAIGKGEIVALILLDLSAAFDTIDHGILLSRLKKAYAITDNALEWIRSYLTKRSFSVRINNSDGDKHEMLFGVPQGSLLGPLLFILYTKDIEKIANKYGLSIHIYADDTQLYIGFESLTEKNDTKTAIEKCLDDIKRWMSLNFLKLNSDKTDLIYIGKKSKLTSFSGLQITHENETLASSKIVKTLGVFLDANLTMEREINQKCSSAYFHLRNIGRVKRCLDESHRILLVQSLILSKLDYCNSVLANVPGYLIKKLQRVMNAGVRFIYDVRKREHITPYMMRAHFLPVKYRIKFKLCLIVFKSLNNLAPEYLSEMMIPHIPTLRNERDILLLKISPNKEKTIYYQMCVSWNSLPLYIRKAETIVIFKRELKKYYFNEAYGDDSQSQSESEYEL